MASPEQSAPRAGLRVAVEVGGVKGQGFQRYLVSLHHGLHNAGFHPVDIGSPDLLQRLVDPTGIQTLWRYREEVFETTALIENRRLLDTLALPGRDRSLDGQHGEQLAVG